MYRKILCALDNSAADQTLLPHVTALARLLKSELLLLHVADGWVARNFDQLQLSGSDEMKDDWSYLEKTAERLRADSALEVNVFLALGNPPDQILKVAESEKCDLIAMTSHGHRFVGDLIHGRTIDVVRHKTSLPLLIVRAEKI